MPEETKPMLTFSKVARKAYLYKNEKKRKNPYFWVGPVLAGNRLWVANSEGDVGTVDPATGTYSLFTELNDGVMLEPVVANRTLYILDDSGKISAFR